MFLIVINWKDYLKIKPDQFIAFSSKTKCPNILLLVSILSFSVNSVISSIMVNVFDT